MIICPSFVRTLSRYVLSWNGDEVNVRTARSPSAGRDQSGWETLSSRPGPCQGVTATPSEPWDGAVTVAGDKGLILPVTGLIANCDRAPSCSLVT